MIRSLLACSPFPLAVATLLALQGCDSTTSPVIPATDVEAVTQTSISGIVGAAASPTPIVRVFDSKTRRPLPNIPVEFRIVTEGGSLANAIVVTDANGRASPGEWRFSTLPGPSSVNVYIDNMFKVQFTATLMTDVPAKLVAATSTDQAALPGQSVHGPSVNVRDRFDNLVSGVVVSFTVTDGGGVLEKSTVTSVHGFAGTDNWTLGTTLGHNRAIATAPGLTAVVFNAESLDPTTIKWYELDSVRSGSVSLSPIQMGVTSAKLGITRFDSCLCKKQDGYFIDEVLYSDRGGAIYNESGRYSLNNATLTISSLSNPVIIQNGTLILLRLDPDVGISFTWVYKEISP